MTTTDEFKKATALLTVEYKDFQPLSGPRREMWWASLAGFPDGALMASVTRYIKSSSFAPHLNDILKGCDAQTDGGWLGAEEAWALMPKSEHESAMLTTEIAQAIAAASPLIESGDRVAARMAFKDCYTRLVERAKLEGRQPRYFPSYGTDKHGVVSMLAKAVQIGQVPVSQAIEWKPEHATEIVRMAGVPNHPLLAAPSESGKAKVKALLADLRALK